MSLASQINLYFLSLFLLTLLNVNVRIYRLTETKRGRSEVLSSDLFLCPNVVMLKIYHLHQKNNKQTKYDTQVYINAKTVINHSYKQ